MTFTSPATLVAILVAARRAGDRDLERDARRKLDEEHGIRVQFSRQSTAVDRPEQAEAVRR